MGKEKYTGEEKRQRDQNGREDDKSMNEKSIKIGLAILALIGAYSGWQQTLTNSSIDKINSSVDIVRDAVVEDRIVVKELKKDVEHLGSRVARNEDNITLNNNRFTGHEIQDAKYRGTK